MPAAQAERTAAEYENLAEQCDVTIENVIAAIRDTAE